MININDNLLDEFDMYELHVLLHIAKRIGADRTCWPSMKTLMKDTGLSKSKLLSVRKSLENKNAIEVTERKINNGNNKSNIYKVKCSGIGIYIDLKDTVKDNKEKAIEPGTSEIPGGYVRNTTPSTSEIPGGYAENTLSINNRSINKEEVIAKSDDLPKPAFLAIDGLKKKIGPKHYELLKEACTSDEIKPIVDAMLSDGRFEKLMDWLEYKKKIRKGLNVSWAIKSLIKEASAFDLVEINEALKKSTQSGYTGIFFKKISQKQREYLEQLNPETPSLNVSHKKELSENEIEKRETLLAMIAFREAQAARKSQTA